MDEDPTLHVDLFWWMMDVRDPGESFSVRDKVDPVVVTGSQNDIKVSVEREERTHRRKKFERGLGS